jgi:protein-disulfide isomerase
MKLRGILKTAALAAAAVFLIGAGSQPRANWHTVMARTELGNRVGNPDAKAKVVEFFSYTCPHCAEFASESDAALKLGYLAPGKISIEYRHLIRDPVDLTIGMLVNCGAPAKFLGNHDAFMLTQSRWAGPLARHTAAQEARWRTPGVAGRRAIVTDFGFYAIMERRGYTRVAIDRCLADQAMADKLAGIAAKEWDRPGVDSTPTFAINNVVMPGTHTWAALEPQIKGFL